jgi:putative ABC transport system substrate-binding protein
MRRREFIRLLGSAAAAAWPFAARAQARMPVVGVLRFDSKDIADEIFTKPFRSYMQAIGWEDGRNIRFLFVFTEGRNERASEFAGEFVAQNVDLVVTFGDPGIRAAQRATSIIPIVGMTDDMVGSGLAASLAHPGGNTTGVSILASELDVKRLEILHEFAPHARRIAALADPSTISTRVQLQNAARELGVELIRFEAQSAEDILRALDAIAAAKVEAVNVLASPLLYAASRSIIERMRDTRMPAVYQWPETADEGGLLGYGPRIQLCYRQMVTLIDKVLRGAKPADLPIEQPAKF